MDIFEALHTRRSIRAYTDEAVSDEDIHVLLDAAMAAPSAGNSQPWEFVVIRDKALLREVPAINPYAAMAAKAPVAILVCGNPKAEKYPGFWVQDCSAAVQNLLLAVTGRDLGAVWTGIYPLEDRVTGMRNLFKLPEHIVPLALIVVGHPAAQPKHVSRYDDQKVHIDFF